MITYFYKFLWFFVIYIFVVIILVQFYVILVRNNMFHKKNIDHSILVTISYYVIDTVYLFSWNKLINYWPILMMQLTETIFFWPNVVFNLTMEWPPRGFVGLTIFHMIFSIFNLNVGTLCGILPVQHYNVIDIFCFFLNLLINQ